MGSTTPNIPFKPWRHEQEKRRRYEQEIRSCSSRRGTLLQWSAGLTGILEDNKKQHEQYSPDESLHNNQNPICGIPSDSAWSNGYEDKSNDIWQHRLCEVDAAEAQLKTIKIFATASGGIISLFNFLVFVCCF